VLFRENSAAARPKSKKASRLAKGGRERTAVGKLEDELAASRDYLQSIIQELEAANEELQSANEEILSSNEELQSTNEELDTAKEELQSTNEELNTVNDELQLRNQELGRANSDLTNLLGIVQIALVMVESDLRIRRLTPMAERLLNLLPTDVGRPITDIKPSFDCPDLENLIREVIDTVTPKEREVRDQQGRWLSLQIRPYKSVDNRIEGAVLAIYDVERAKSHELAAQAARNYAEAIVATIRESLIVLDENLRVKNVNRAFCDTFRVSPDETVGGLVYEIGNGQWDVPQLRTLLGDVLPKRTTIEGFEVEHEFPTIGRRTMRVNARRVQGTDGSPQLILLAIEDVTDDVKRESGARARAE
jgi:two-component system CheB/CheR fusion protein